MFRVSTTIDPPIFNTLFETGILPLYFHKDIEVMKAIVDSCYSAGIRVFEFMNRADNAFKLFNQLSAYAAQTLPGMKLAVGTVCDPDTALRYIDAGASIIIAPNINPIIAGVCKKKDIPWIPGIFTPSELYLAKDHGATLVKLFPADLSSPAFIKAMKGPTPDIRFIASGGITPNMEAISKWIIGGADVVGIGSSLFSQTKASSADDDLVSLLASCINSVKSTRSQINSYHSHE
jgi:2-dehydro-3-deoxyphosphogluconate aldolase / (4S)-4-hydroxy-2-oxoglutarate aldolase